MTPRCEGERNIDQLDSGLTDKEEIYDWICNSERKQGICL